METKEINDVKEKMDPEDKILKLIEEGDADTILSENYVQKSFNDLLKYELVVIKDDKISLTELGTVARMVGVKKVISEVKAKKIALNTIDPTIEEKKVRTTNWHYYILLLIGLMMILLIQIYWN